jgi:hypothetical protein
MRSAHTHTYSHTHPRAGKNTHAHIYTHAHTHAHTRISVSAAKLKFKGLTKKGVELSEATTAVFKEWSAFAKSSRQCILYQHSPPQLQPRCYFQASQRREQRFLRVQKRDGGMCTLDLTVGYANVYCVCASVHASTCTCTDSVVCCIPVTCQF